MTAAEAREELEAVIWRTRAIDHHAIIGILAAADRYATAFAADTLDAIEREHRADRHRAELAAELAGHDSYITGWQHRRTG